ncbi:hypothetical protein FRB95_007133 [Tulasnella sp. JGI-2019a]|nr:hypothetical protein FRB95_007133 [Tulasnella sp. JGI-2019a]
MGLFSRKNKDTGNTSGSENDTATGTHRHNTLHKRPPTDTTNETLADGTHPNVALGTIPRDRSISPTTASTAAITGTGDTDPSDGIYASQSYEDGGFGFGGSRRADYTTSAAPMGTMHHTYGEASGNPGVMSNQVYEMPPGGEHLGTHGQGMGAGTQTQQTETQQRETHTGRNVGLVAGAGVAGLAAADVAHRRCQQDQPSTIPGGFPSDDDTTMGSRSRGVSSNQAEIGAGHDQYDNQAANANAGSTTRRRGIASNQPNEAYRSHNVGAKEGFAHETMESARAKLRAALEADEAALRLVAAARLAAKEAKEIIAHLGAEAEEEARLASIKQKEASTLLEQSSHLGRV